ncbi:MAG: hypothetical protein ABIE03_06905 [Patescibacteria group bacterium]|nr:hypothetical protein [Patescibacteria group bacterium]
MKKNLRKFFQEIFASLSSKAYKKHDLKVILITGWAGTSIVREMVYHLLKPSSNVRRNTTEVWWDMSVPLTILGYEDRRRNLLEWAFLILKASLSLVLRPRYAHTVIINLDSSIEDTAKYWFKSINPDKIVVLKERPESKVLKNLLSIQGIESSTFIFNPQQHHQIETTVKKKFTYSTDDPDLSYTRKKDLLVIKYKNEQVSIKIPRRSKFIWEFIPPALAVGLNHGIPLKDMGESLSSFSYHPRQVERAVFNLKKFVHDDE